MLDIIIMFDKYLHKYVTNDFFTHPLQEVFDYVKKTRKNQIIPKDCSTKLAIRVKVIDIIA